MPDPLFWRCVDEMDEALDELATVANAVREVYRSSTQRVRDGARISDIIEERGTVDRRRLEEAIRQTQSSIRRTRSHLIRTMVAEEEMTLTGTAKLMGISRQAVSALYQEGINESSLPAAE